MPPPGRWLVSWKDFLVTRRISSKVLCVGNKGVPKGSESVSCSVVSDSATPWTVAHQVLLSVGFSRQEYWSG